MEGATKADQRLLDEVDTRIRYYLASAESELILEPMNSYKRRLVHQLALQYQLDTFSEGEEPERHVRLVKTGRTRIPDDRPAPALWDYGRETFLAHPGREGIHLALKIDGSVEVYDPDAPGTVLDDRVIHSRRFRIRQGRIVVPEDAEWSA